jgi:hypothetical protein
MNETQRRLARLEAASSENWTPWRSIIWDPRTGETLAEAKVRQLGPDWRGNTIVHRIVCPPPRPDAGASR